MEDFLDCLNVMYLSFDFVFLFDRLCGHNQAREGILKATITRNHFGGKQPSMRYTVMLVGDVFLGPYARIFETGDTQHMWWNPALPDNQLTGPFQISDM